MFFATSQLSPLSSTDHMDYDHVLSECVWSQSIRIDEQRQANTHSGPMTTWPTATHSGSIQLGPHKAKSHSPMVPAPTSCAGSVRSQDHAARPTLFGRAVVNRPFPADSTCGRETRPLVAERNPQIGSSLRHSVRDYSQQTRPLVAESIAHLWQRETHKSVRHSDIQFGSREPSQQHCYGMLRQFLSKRFWVFPVSPCT